MLLSTQFDFSGSFNQATVAYDATKVERLDALSRKRAETEERLRN